MAMNRIKGHLVCLAILAAGPRGTSAENTASPPTPGDAVSLPVLAASDGRWFDAAALAGKKAVVIAWTDLQCPMAKLYAPRLAALESEFTARGVQFFVVDSTREDSVEALAARAREVKLEAALVHDAGGELAVRLGVRRTTEVLVLGFDASSSSMRPARLAYRGALDDQYGYRRGAGQGTLTYRKEKPSRGYLRDALEAVLQGKPPDPAETDALGCELTLPAAAPEATGPVPTFHEAVEPILQRRCQECHRPGAAAPFALVAYDDARRRARMLREVVRERRMPPWGGDRRFGKFRNDPSLTDEEIAVIAQWVEAGAPRGDPEKAHAPPRFEDGWGIGEPDQIFETPPVDVPAEGVVPYRYVSLKNEAQEDRWVEAAQLRSSVGEAVHHVLVFLTKVPPPAPGAARPWKPSFNPFSLLEGAKPSEYPVWIERFKTYIRKDLKVGEAGGLNGYLVSSNAGGQPTVFPQGCARFLPAGATIVLQIHYTPTGQAHESRTRLGLRFAKGPPPRALDSRGLATVAFAIPPGAASHEVEASYTLPRGATLHSLRPHMHVRGKSFRYVAELPEGGSEVLLEVPAWDFDWQIDYIIAEPRRFAAGTRLRAIATYDNSAANPYNPDPAKTVYFGLQSDEEMMIGYFDVVWDGEETAKRPAPAPGG